MLADCLMVIDIQPAFTHPDSPWFMPALPGMLPRIEALVAGFGHRVVFTRFVPPSQVSGSWRAYYHAWPFALETSSSWLWSLEQPWQDRPSFASHTFSKWGATLRDACGAGAAVLCGVSTDCCVLMTALSAVDDGAAVRIVTDACAAKTPAHHDCALQIMASRAPQLTLTTVAAELARQLGRKKSQSFMSSVR